MAFKNEEEQRAYNRKYKRKQREDPAFLEKEKDQYRVNGLKRKLQGLVNNLTESELEALLRQKRDAAAQEGRPNE